MFLTKQYSRLYVGLIAVLSLVPRFGISAEGQEWQEFRKQNHGLVLTVKVPKGQVPWHFMVVIVVLENVSKSTIHYGVISVLGGFRMSLADAANHIVPLTENGRLEMDDWDKVGSIVTGDLGPGDKSEREVRLWEYFDLVKPGNYKLSVAWLAFPYSDPIYRLVEIEGISIAVPAIY